MKAHQLRRCALLSALGIIAPIGQALAAPVDIPDFSFEQLGLAAGGWNNDEGPNWQERDGTADGDSFVEHITGFASAGTQHLGMNAGYYSFQDLGIPWQATTRYTLTVGVGNRNAAFTAADNASLFGLTNVLPSSDGTGTIETLTPTLLASGTENAFDLAAAGTFVDGAPVIFETGATPPTGNVIIVIASTGGNRAHFDNIRLDALDLGDDDGDGLPNFWEETYGFDPNDDGTTGETSPGAKDGPDGALADGDADGLNNLGEYENETDPTVPDTDADNLNDGDEIALMSNPLVQDTDGDSLLDGDEVNGTGGSISSPILLDTDGDGYTDPGEIRAGTDASSAGSVPLAGSGSQVGINFVGGRNATNGGFIGIATTTTNDATAGLPGIEQANWTNQGGVTALHAGQRDSDGNIVATNLTFSGVPNTWSLNATIDNSPIGVGFPYDGDAALMQGYLDSTDVSTTSITVHDVLYPTYDVVIYMSGDTAVRFADITANGQTILQAEHGTGWDIVAGGTPFVRHFAPGQATLGNYVVFHGLTGPRLDITATPNGGVRAPIQGIQIIDASTDTDGDGIPDGSELILGTGPGISNAGLDSDSDGVDDPDEFLDLTDIFEADTDNDGVNDGPEATGGMNPLISDTDADGLIDGAEDLNGNGAVDAGETDPLDDDTDGDTIIDGTDLDPLDNNNDQDGDGIGNFDEQDGTFNPWTAGVLGTAPGDPTDILLTDSDADGLNDLEDINAGTDPNNPDVDLDSLEDGYEVNVSGSDPLDISDPPLVDSAIGLNFVGDLNPAPLDPGVIAGHPNYRQTGWNSTLPYVEGALAGTEADIDTPTVGLFTNSNGDILSDTMDDTGFPTLLGNWSSTTRYSSFNGVANANATLMNNYIDAGNPTITFFDIPYEYFDVVVYVGSDGNGRDGIVSLLDEDTFIEIGRKGYNSMAAFGSFTASNYIVTSDVDGTTFPPANVVIFPSVNTDAITIINEFQTANTGIFAIQLVESGPPVTNFAITSIEQVGATSFELTWTGGDGTNTIQSSPSGEDGTWTDLATDVASPTTVDSDPSLVSPLFMRVIEPSPGP